MLGVGLSPCVFFVMREIEKLWMKSFNDVDAESQVTSESEGTTATNCSTLASDSNAASRSGSNRAFTWLLVDTC